MTLHHFAQNTNIHGFSDFVNNGPVVKTLVGMCLLGFVCVSSWQVTVLIRDYVESNVGTSVKYYPPTELPAVVVCLEDWVDRTRFPDFPPRLARYLMGYLPGSSFALFVGSEARAVISSDNPTIAGNFSLEQLMAEQLLAENNGSLEQVFHKYMLYTDNVGIRNILPSHLEMENDRFLSWHGPCTRFHSNTPVNDLVRTFLEVSVELFSSKVNYTALWNEGVLKTFNGTEEQSSRQSSFMYDLLFLDDPASLSIPSNQRLTFGHWYDVTARPTRVVRQHTASTPCRKWSRMDRVRCFAVTGNEVCQKHGNCVTYAPKLRGEQEVRGNICNAISHGYGNMCATQLMVIPHYTDVLTEKCPQPCTEQFYTFTHQITETNRNGGEESVFLVIHLDGAGGLVIEEYFIITPQGLLSGIGGTLGLWLGASIYSIVQGLFLLFCCGKKGKLTEIQLTEGMYHRRLSRQSRE